MNRLLLPTLFALATAAAAANAADLTPVPRPELATVLGLSEELARTPADAGQSYIVRVFAAPVAIGECGGPVVSCPQVRLLIAVSSGDLGERPTLFELPAQKGWEFVGWSAPAASGRKPVVEFTVRSVLPEANVSSSARAAWRSRTYRVRVTPESASYAAP